MKNRTRLLIAFSIAMVVLNGLSFYQFFIVYSLNNELTSQNDDLQNQLNELQTSDNSLQNQVDNLQNENDDLKEKISELRKQNSDYHYRIEELEEQLTEWVKITDFRTSGFNPIGGLAIMSDAVVTIQNFGTEPVYGLVLHLKSSTCSIGSSVKIESIRVGEVKTISTYLDWCLTGSSGTTTLTLRKGNTILDEVVL
ncbi:MAG: coiled-coil domain-containing protein [archaeon]